MANVPNDGSFPSNPQFPILNPLTPMAYLPPDTARETTVASHILVGTLAILIWDVLSNFSSDWRLLTQYRIRLPTITYFLSRICSLIYVAWSTIYYTGPVGSCYVNEKALGAFYPASVSLSALLFFFRVRIVYESHKWIVAFFFFLWLTVVAGTMTAAFGVLGVHIGPTDYCLNAQVEEYVAAATITPLVHDTLVFLAITYRLAENSHASANKKHGLWAKFTGDYLPGVSRGLLKDGQTYYMVTVFSNLLTVVMIYMTSLPATYRTIFSAPNIMLINVMACRVFRHTKFGVFKQSTFTNSTMLATDVRNASVLPVNFRQTMTGQELESHILDPEHITFTHSPQYVNTNYNDYKPPVTPTSAMSAMGIDMKRTVEVEQTVHHENQSQGYPPSYPPPIRKYPNSDSNRF
ncbi:hypothetical protein FA15DRAFT_660246 [Coprinopsis marcescibilis]|uniref:G-protein coupled receptors family 1 profile domain-containing protein n=1 Tax=Coprinopsis marcescibilis TaxID=230819 RepID=A0A5C3KFV6_COPMA|nr:hypothetical protein FA15DRAFT_660246 [Coprinopsis marcescibilis]